MLNSIQAFVKQTYMHLTFVFINEIKKQQ